MADKFQSLDWFTSQYKKVGCYFELVPGWGIEFVNAIGDKQHLRFGGHEPDEKSIALMLHAWLGGAASMPSDSLTDKVDKLRTDVDELMRRVG